jgi:hypothetical protein
MLIPFWIAFHLPMILTSPDRFGLWWALMIVGLAFTMTWLHLNSAGSVLLAIVCHAVANAGTPAVLQMFGDGDRLAVRLSAVLWLLVGRPADRTAGADRRQAATLPDDGDVIGGRGPAGGRHHRGTDVVGQQAYARRRTTGGGRTCPGRGRGSSRGATTATARVEDPYPHHPLAALRTPVERPEAATVPRQGLNRTSRHRECAGGRNRRTAPERR